MDLIEEGRQNYHREMEKRQQILDMLNSEDIQKLVKMGLVTTHQNRVPTEKEILHDSFNSAACRISYLHENPYVYVGDFMYHKRGRGFRCFEYTKTRDWDKDFPLVYESDTKKYVGLLTERGKIVCPWEWEDFKRYHTIIHLPYSYTISEIKGPFLVGEFPLVKEAFATEGFCEQFFAIQEYYFRQLLNGTYEDADKAIKNKELLKKICIRK